MRCNHHQAIWHHTLPSRIHQWDVITIKLCDHTLLSRIPLSSLHFYPECINITMQAKATFNSHKPAINNYTALCKTVVHPQTKEPWIINYIGLLLYGTKWLLNWWAEPIRNREETAEVFPIWWSSSSIVTPLHPRMFNSLTHHPLPSTITCIQTSLHIIFHHI